MKRLAAICYLLCGCFRPSRIESPGISAEIPAGPGAAASIWDHIAYWGSGIGALCVLAGIVMMWINPKNAPRVIFIGISLLIGAQSMFWISAHLGLITIILLLCGALYAIVKHRKQIADTYEDVKDMFDADTEKIENEK